MLKNVKKALVTFIAMMLILYQSGCAIVIGVGAMAAREVIYDIKEKFHYSDKANFVEEFLRVDGMFNYEDRIVFWLSKVDETSLDGFWDKHFEAVGKNVEVLRSKGLYRKVSNGDIIKCVYAPTYFGNGDIRPIVSITTTDGEVLLEFEEGQRNLLDSYK